MDRRTFVLSSAALGALGALPGRSAALPVFGGRAFGSYWRVALGSETPVAPLTARIEAVVAVVDAQMSPYRSDSVLSGINARGNTDWQPVPDGMATVLDAALQVAGRSGGAFDPTVGGLVGRYGFGPIRGARVGDVSDLSLRDGALRKAKAGLTVDLCGIAKGHALDRIMAELAGIGLHDVLVELGGEVATRGRHPEGRAWRVALEAPEGARAHALELPGKAVATSGGQAQGYGLAGRGYGHIIDPRSGTPATGDLVSVSVIDDSAMQADALATALFALGTEGAGAMAGALGLDAVLQVRDGAGTRVLTTGRAAGWLL